MSHTDQTIKDTGKARLAGYRAVVQQDGQHIGSRVVVDSGMALAVAVDAVALGLVHRRISYHGNVPRVTSRQSRAMNATPPAQLMHSRVSVI